MLRKFWIVGLVIAAWGWPIPVWSQPVPDHTLGRDRSRVIDRVRGNSRDFEISGGARRGQNLFHSFRQFDVDAGGSVYFLNPRGVTNIFSRVTGVNRSEILGTLGVRGGANLFLLNPNGILFGSNASLDLRGAFVGTTANAIQFEAAGSFNATDPTLPPLLKVSPSAFLFHHAPGRILNRAQLRVPNGAGLILLGGDVTIQDGALNAYGGGVAIGAVEAGSVGLAEDGGLIFSDDLQKADILFDHALVDVSLDNLGNVYIAGDRIDLEHGSVIKAGIESGLGTVRSRAGDVYLEANIVRLRQSSLITNSIDVGGVGRAGNVVIDAGQVQFVASSILSQIRPTGRGRGGNILVQADLLSLSNGAELTASTFGRGNAGNVAIGANQIRFDGISADGQTPSGVFNNTAGVGRGGNIAVWADSLSLTRGAQLTASTFGRGDAGHVTIDAGQVRFNASGAFSTVQEAGQGRGGNISINAGSLRLTQGAKLAASTFGRGDAGNVTIDAEQVRFNTSGAFSTVEATGRGRGGNVRIEADSLFLTNGAEIDTSTSGQGNAGDVRIDAEQARFNAGFASSQVTRTGRGQGGDVAVNANLLVLTRGSELTASTFGRGNTGNVIVNVDRARFEGTSANGQLLSGIFNTVAGTGQGGNIKIRADSLSLSQGAELAASTFGRGNAGNIRVEAGSVSFDGTSVDGQYPSGISSSVQPSGRGSGGNVSIRADSVSITNEAQLNVSTSGRGNAGNIRLDAEQIKFDASDAFSQVTPTGRGRGGNIEVNADSLSLSQGGELTASTFGRGNAGNVVINVDRARFEGMNPTGQLSGIFNTVGPTGRGRGGNIAINAGSLSLSNEAALSASTFGQGQSGDITIKADDRIQLDQSSIFATAAPTATRQSGDINITASGLRLFDHSRIRTDDQRPGIVSGGGGNIRVDTNYILATNGSDILAFSSGGRGGNIDLPLFFSQDEVQTNSTQLNRNQQAQLILNDRINIDASGRVSGGAVGVVTPDTSTIQNSLSDLPENAIDADRLLANSCIARTPTGGTFLITGSGGLPESPSNPATVYPTGEVRSIPVFEPDRSWQPGDPIVEPQGVYRLPNGRVVMSRECQKPL